MELSVILKLGKYPSTEVYSQPYDLHFKEDTKVKNLLTISQDQIP